MLDRTGAPYRATDLETRALVADSWALRVRIKNAWDGVQVVIEASLRTSRETQALMIRLGKLRDKRVPPPGSPRSHQR